MTYDDARIDVLRTAATWTRSTFGGLAAPLEHVDGLVILGRETGWSRQASWVE